MKRLKHFAALSVVLASVALAESPVAFPNTKPGILMRAWLQLVTSGDRDGLVKFLTDNYSAENLHGRTPVQIAAGQLQIAETLRGLELKKIEESSDTVLRVVLSGHTAFPSLLRGEYKFDPGQGRIVQSLFRPMSERDTGAAKMPLQDLLKDLDQRLEEAAKGDEFSGSVLIAKDGKPVFQKAWGYADRDSKLANTLETRYRLGSMPKRFTSVAIAQLISAGKLKYTDTLARVLPDYPNQDAARKITVAQLLTHTSGLGDIFDEEFDQKKDTLHTLRDYLGLFAKKPLQFEPGKGWAYSNAGYVVLGLILEKASGQSYFDYLQQHVFGPAGMASTGNTPLSERPPSLAKGYTRGPDGKLVRNDDTLPWRGSSAGGGESTVGDLLRFANALRGYKLLNEALTNEITTGKVSPFPGESSSQYAYGFEDHREGGARAVGHGGGAPGMNGTLQVYWDEGYVIVVLANLDPPAAETVASYIGARLPLAHP